MWAVLCKRYNAVLCKFWDTAPSFPDFGDSTPCCPLQILRHVALKRFWDNVTSSADLVTPCWPLQIIRYHLRRVLRYLPVQILTRYAVLCRFWDTMQSNADHRYFNLCRVLRYHLRRFWDNARTFVDCIIKTKATGTEKMYRCLSLLYVCCCCFSCVCFLLFFCFCFPFPFLLPFFSFPLRPR